MASSPERVTVRGYLGSYVALLVLATISLLGSGLPDATAVTLSLVIAAIKAACVLLFFMHLIEERFSFRFVMVVSSLLVCVFIALTTLDPVTRAPFAPEPSRNPSYSAAGVDMRAGPR